MRIQNLWGTCLGSYRIRCKNKSTVDWYRNYLDPVSVFDRSSNMTIKTNPLTSPSLTHAFDYIADQFKSGDSQHAYGYPNPDGSISLTS